MTQSRKLARETAVQALYQWQMTGQNVAEIQGQFLEHRDLSKVQLSYFTELTGRVPSEIEPIDSTLNEFVDRSIQLIDPVERAILRIGVYELIYRLEIPYRVILNECINLAKKFGATESHKYINGILDKVALTRRPKEVSAHRSMPQAAP